MGWRQVLVHGEKRHQRANYVRHSLQRNGYDRHRRLPLIGMQVPQQPLHQPAVVRFAQDLFFVVGSHAGKLF